MKIKLEDFNHNIEEINEITFYIAKMVDIYPSITESVTYTVKDEDEDDYEYVDVDLEFKTCDIWDSNLTYRDIFNKFDKEVSKELIKHGTLITYNYENQNTGEQLKETKILKEWLESDLDKRLRISISLDT